MYFDYIIKEAKRNRENNSLYFFSLVLIFIISYTVLSFKEMEISSFLYEDMVFYIGDNLKYSYIISLGFLLILVFAATKDQLEDRSKQLGLLLMLGRRKSKITNDLVLESILNSIYAILIAFPIAIFLNEFINLITIKILQLGFRSHTLKISLYGFLVSSLILIFLQILSIKLISFFILRKETSKLFKGIKNYNDLFVKVEQRKKLLFLSLIFLIIAIFVFLNFPPFKAYKFFILSLFCFYMGLAYIINKRVKNKVENIFELRLIEEKLKYDYKSLFLVNLIIIGAFGLLSTSITSVTLYNNETEDRPDFTIYDNQEVINQMYKDEKYNSVLENPIPIYMANIYDTNLSPIMIYVNKDKIGFSLNITHILKESSYNQLLKFNSKNQIELEDNQVMLLINEREDNEQNYKDIINIYIDNYEFELVKNIQFFQIFSNNQVFNDSALIVSDQTYNKVVLDNEKTFAYNFYIKTAYKNQEGIIGANDNIRNFMIKDNLKYESRIWKIKNNVSDLVYKLYTELYLGLVLFIIANSYLAFKLIYWIKSNRYRFLIMIRLGAKKEDLKKSIEKIINYYFITLMTISLLANMLYMRIVNYSMDISNKKIYLMNLALLVFELISFLLIKNVSKKEIDRVGYYEKDNNSRR